MTKEIQSILTEWQITRWSTLEFINHVGEEDLKKELPRAGLNTFTKHFEELIAVEESAINAIEQGKMTFCCCKNDSDYPGDSSVNSLVERMKFLDKRLYEVLEDKSNNYVIDWDGSKSNPIGHVGWMIMHEAMHIGQLVAFSYVLGIEIPNSVTKAWALSGDKK